MTRITISAAAKRGFASRPIDVGGQTINTATAMGRMFLTMMAGFAELERGLARERADREDPGLAPGWDLLQQDRQAPKCRGDQGQAGRRLPRQHDPRDRRQRSARTRRGMSEPAA